MRQPDIEIYLKDSQREAITEWLTTVLGAPCAWQQKGRVSRTCCANIPVVYFEQAVGKWHSLLLESAETPWADDIECAKAAAAHLQINVRSLQHGVEESPRRRAVRCAHPQIWRVLASVHLVSEVLERGAHQSRVLHVVVDGLAYLGVSFSVGVKSVSLSVES